MTDTVPVGPPIIEVRNLKVGASERTILDDVTLDVFDRQVTAVIGPSGSGKTTFIRTLNRMVETTPGLRVEGSIRYQGQDIHDPRVNPVLLRQRIGMVFQRPAVFPMSIYNNVVFGLRLNGTDPSEFDRIVGHSLERAGLLKELQGNLDRPAFELSGGQQQRLCIARALAVKPRVLLMDEPTGSLDPISTQRVEETVEELRREIAIVIVTHSIAQAARVSDRTAYFYQGRLVEVAPTEVLFERPTQKLTEEYITGRFG